MSDDDHPALAVHISPTTACRLFPDTPASVFWWEGHAHGSGVRLTFGAAYRAASAFWGPRAKAAQSARFSITHRQVWAVRRAAAAEAALARLQEVIEAELAALTGQGD